MVALKTDLELVWRWNSSNSSNAMGLSLKITPPPTAWYVWWAELRPKGQPGKHVLPCVRVFWFHWIQLQSYESVSTLSVMPMLPSSAHFTFRKRQSWKSTEQELFCITCCNFLAISTNVNGLLLLNAVLMTWHE